MVPAPLTGRMVREDVAQRHPIAVMVDDQRDARPQSGFNAASVVWQAPAEGGIPRYMLIFQDRVPPPSARCAAPASTTSPGPPSGRRCTPTSAARRRRWRRSARKGSGQFVYNADEFRWGGVYF